MGLYWLKVLSVDLDIYIERGGNVCQFMAYMQLLLNHELESVDMLNIAYKFWSERFCLFPGIVFILTMVSGDY